MPRKPTPGEPLPTHSNPRWVRWKESNGIVWTLRSGPALRTARKAAPPPANTQAGLAAAVGCGKATIGHLESGQRATVYAALGRAIADAVRIDDPAALFDIPAPDHGGA